MSSGTMKLAAHLPGPILSLQRLNVMLILSCVKERSSQLAGLYRSGSTSM